MPIYEYQCELCGERLDKLQKVADAPLTQCPACGQAGLKKLISRSAFRLKGSGWYVTDFKNPPKDKVKEDKAKTESHEPKTQEKTEDTKDNKSTQKTDTKVDKD